MDSLESQEPATKRLSEVSNFWGQKARVHTACGLLLMVKSSAPVLSFIKIVPLIKPIARSCPSGDQSQAVHFAGVFCLFTFYWSDCHKPKSIAEQLARFCNTGLKARHWILSLWLYFKSPSPTLDQMTTLLSEPPVANFYPSLA